MKKMPQHNLSNEIISRCDNDKIKDITRIVTSVFVRQCKHYGLYYCLMVSGIKNKLNSNNIGNLFSEINKGTIKEIFEYTQSPLETDVITLMLNKLINVFIDGKGFANQSKLGTFGLKCFNLICKIHFGDDFKEEKDVTPQSWFDVFCHEKYQQNQQFHNIDFASFVRSNYNLLKSAYKFSDYIKLEEKGAPLFCSNNSDFKFQMPNVMDDDDLYL